MKKPIYLLFALCILAIVSCKHPNTNSKDAKMTEDMMAKENKSLAQERKYTSKEEGWTVKLTGELKDTRTIEEKLKDIPPKEDIVNTVLFYNFNTMNFNTKDNPCFSSIEVQKRIQYHSHDISFNLKISINTKPNVPVSSKIPLQINLSEGGSLNINTPQIIYKRNEEVFRRAHIETQDIIATSELSIKEINLLRSQQDGFTIFLNTVEGVFKLKCPSIFIKYLKEF